MACNNTIVAPPPPPPINTIFIKMGESSPVYGEHAHTGRPHTRIDNSVFKKSNVMSSMKKKNRKT